MNLPKKWGPAFQHYAGDYLSDLDIGLLTLEEEGALNRAVCHCWTSGYIPNDDDKLSRLLKGASTTVVRQIKRFFEQDPNDPSRLIHKGLDEQREKQRQWKEKSAEGGKKSGDIRRKSLEDQHQASSLGEPPSQPPFNHPSTTAEPPYEGWLNTSSSISSSTSNSKPKDTISGVSPESESPRASVPKKKQKAQRPEDPKFEELWPDYWRRESKEPGRKAWDKLIAQREDPDKIIAAVKAQKPAMLTREIQFRPLLATWLNARRWEDEAQQPEISNDDLIDRVVRSRNISVSEAA
jgi:uncharacterized protein YdaU (DUF1376 family)